jgi:hypothetical protein
VRVINAKIDGAGGLGQLNRAQAFADKLGRRAGFEAGDPALLLIQLIEFRAGGEVPHGG